MSVNMPVAVNCLVVPRAMLGLVGVSWIETSVAGVTVSVVWPDTPENVAVIVVEPVAPEVASPVELIVATAVLDESHVTDALRSWFELSVNIPVAVNCLVVPSAMLGLVGVTSIVTRAFDAPSRVKLALSPPLQPYVKLKNSAAQSKQNNLLSRFFMAQLRFFVSIDKITHNASGQNMK